jgi:transposase-like protein
MPPSRTVAPYSPAPAPQALRQVFRDRQHLPPFIPVTNPLERSLGEVKRRTKVIGRFPGEESCLSLVWAVLDLQINNACNGVTLSDIDRHKLHQLRHAPAESDAEEKEVIAA